MAQVSPATGAVDLDPVHSEGIIVPGSNVLGVDGPEKTGPPGLGIEFGVGNEEFQATPRAKIDALPVVVPIEARAGPFGVMPPQDLVLFGLQELLPFGVRFDDLVPLILSHTTLLQSDVIPRSRADRLGLRRGNLRFCRWL